MNKIPVGQTIGHAYSFAFKGFFRILGAAWLPFALITAAGFLLSESDPSALTTAFDPKNPVAILRVWQILGPFYLVTILLMFVAGVGITKEALGLRTGSRFYYFSLDRPLWLLIAALFLVLLMTFAATLVIIFGVSVIGGVIAASTAGTNSSTASKGILGLVAIIGFGIVYCAFIYAIIRQIFLLAPVIVSERKLGLRRTWALGRGNFWRMFVVYLAALIPFLIFEFVCIFYFLHLVGVPPSAAQGATPEQISAWQAHFSEQISAYKYVFYLLSPVGAAAMIVLFGLIYGAQSFAYRALVPAEKQEDVF